MSEPADEKTARNHRVMDRYDELSAAGKHGHYETMFLIVREEVERERERCARVCEARVMGDNNREDEEAKRCAAAIRLGSV